MLNTRSEVIGVLGFKLRGSEGQNFAIPINYVRGLLETANADMDLSELRAKLTEPLAPSAAPRGVRELREVKSIFVGTLGATEAAFLVREKLINRLSGQPGLEVLTDIREADALLTGFVGADAYGRADATVFRLIGSGGKILWCTAPDCLDTRLFKLQSSESSPGEPGQGSGTPVFQPATAGCTW